MKDDFIIREERFIKVLAHMICQHAVSFLKLIFQRL